MTNWIETHAHTQLMSLQILLSFFFPFMSIWPLINCYRGDKKKQHTEPNQLAVSSAISPQNNLKQRNSGTTTHLLERVADSSLENANHFTIQLKFWTFCWFFLRSLNLVCFFFLNNQRVFFVDTAYNLSLSYRNLSICAYFFCRSFPIVSSCFIRSYRVLLAHSSSSIAFVCWNFEN